MSTRRGLGAAQTGTGIAGCPGQHLAGTDDQVKRKSGVSAAVLFLALQRFALDKLTGCGGGEAQGVPEEVAVTTNKPE